MKNNHLKYIYLIIIIILSYQILTHSSIVIASVNYAVDIWKNNLFPPMFTFFILSELLINYGFTTLIGYIFKKPAHFLFKINDNGIYIILMSLLSGFPSSAKYIKDLYQNNGISLKEAQKLLLFTHFSNPLFILGTISISILNNSKIGLLVMLSHYMGNLIIGILVRNYIPSSSTNNNKLKIEIKEKNIILVITNAINKVIDTLLLILGIITICTVFTNVINHHLPSNITIYLDSIFEMTKGLNNLKLLNLSLFTKGLLATMIISFGGISVHMQINSILSGTKIKYMPFLMARIFHSFISGLLYIILYSCFIIV